MRRFLFFSFFLIIPSVVYADLGGDRIGGGEVVIGWREEASADLVRPRVIIVDTGTLYDNGDGSVFYRPASSDFVSNNFLKLNQATSQTITNGAPTFNAGLTLTAGQDIRPSANSTTALNIAQADGTDFVTFDTSNKRVGIGTTAPASALDVAGSARINAILYFLTSTTAKYGINYSTGSGGLNIAESGVADGRIFIKDGGNVGIGTTSPDRILHAELDDSTTNAVSTPFRVTHTTSGTPAANIGVAIDFEVETAASNNEKLGFIDVRAPVVTAAAEEGQFRFRTMTAGAEPDERATFDKFGMTLQDALVTDTNILNAPSLNFDGSNDNIDLGDITEFNSVASFTATAWFIQDVIDTVDIFWPRKYASSTSHVNVFTHSDGYMRFGIADGLASYGQIADYSAVVTAGRWHHMAMVYDGTQATDATRLVVYIDGVQQTLAFSANAIPATTPNLAGVTAYIGMTVTALDGKMRDVRLYSDAKTGANILSIMRGETLTTNLVHHYKLDKGYGVVATDSGSNAVNGTISGCTWTNSEQHGLGTLYPITKLSLGVSTSINDGLSFGNDTWLYRSGVNTLTLSGGLTLDDAKNIVVGTTTGTKIGTATTQKIGFFNATPVVQQTELTDELTTVTHTAPGTPDYALQNLVQNTGFGFATADEGNTALSVIANLQARVNGLETKLAALGLLADAD